MQRMVLQRSTLYASMQTQACHLLLLGLNMGAGLRCKPSGRRVQLKGFFKSQTTSKSSPIAQVGACMLLKLPLRLHCTSLTCSRYAVMLLCTLKELTAVPAGSHEH